MRLSLGHLLAIVVFHCSFFLYKLLFVFSDSQKAQLHFNVHLESIVHKKVCRSQAP